MRIRRRSSWEDRKFGCRTVTDRRPALPVRARSRAHSNRRSYGPAGVPGKPACETVLRLTVHLNGNCYNCRLCVASKGLRMEFDGRSVLVTGGSSGIGLGGTPRGAGDRASFITGVALPVDGGLLAQVAVVLPG
jgi:hypothetical protein